MCTIIVRLSCYPSTIILLPQHDYRAAPHDYLAVPHDYLAAPHDYLAGPHDYFSVPHDYLVVPHDYHVVSYDCALAPLSFIYSRQPNAHYAVAYSFVNVFTHL